MKLKFIKNNEVVFDKDIPTTLSTEHEKELSEFNKSEIVSYLIEFTSGTKVEDIKTVDDMTEENTKQVTVTII